MVWITNFFFAGLELMIKLNVVYKMEEKAATIPKIQSYKKQEKLDKS